MLVTAALSALALVANPLFAQQTKVARIGYLTNRSEKGAREEAFVKGLRELGYVEGRNVVIEWRFAAGNLRFPELAAELVLLKIDVLVVVGVAAALAAKQASGTIPIVMANASDDPVRHGLVASLARPGGNVTGLIDVSAELAGKRLDLLKQLVPKAFRVAILWDPASPAAASQVKEVEIAARKFGMQLQSIEVRRADDFENAYRAATKGRADALIVATYGFFNLHLARLADLEAKTRLPAIYTNPDPVIAGGLMSYSSDIPAQHRRAASYVDRILKGAKPGELPIEQPTKFELVLNMRTAKALGLMIPQSILVRADRVIE